MVVASQLPGRPMLFVVPSMVALCPELVLFDPKIRGRLNIEGDPLLQMLQAGCRVSSQGLRQTVVSRWRTRQEKSECRVPVP